MTRVVTSNLQRVLTLVGARTFPLYAALTGLYVLFRVGSFTNRADRITDTSGYEHVASLPLWSIRFYTGERGFTIPLFFKLLTTSEARFLGQLVFSTAAWLVLAAVIVRHIHSRSLRPIAFAAVLAFSLTTEVILWDTLLLSESVTLALTVLLLVAWIALIGDPRPRLAGAVIVLSLLWAFARDTNAYVLLVVGLFVAVTLVRSAYRRVKLVLVAGCCAIFLADYGSADAGKRWRQPLVDVVVHRVITHPSITSYFEHLGLDVHSNWVASGWIDVRGRSVYLHYLVSHPGYTLAAPFIGRQEALYSTPSNPASLIDPELKIYNDNASLRFLPLPRLAEKVLFPRGIALILVVLGVVLASALVVARFAGADPVWLVPLGITCDDVPPLSHRVALQRCGGGSARAGGSAPAASVAAGARGVCNRSLARSRDRDVHSHWR